ncbi:Endonuclease/exonuclease/phosphatase [Cynara cardunculus var. scolymus]|uniref:Endonuclease/exonuclease/phosphatase n=1 Tax=Cynara cardunculus var. scolymus TaxID=59895 RepID=A0A103WSL2_CYNCS|nr:Endonuclease/exonuclease/phosphatase [Cynara cardunculus var. scolymus]
MTRSEGEEEIHPFNEESNFDELMDGPADLNVNMSMKTSDSNDNLLASMQAKGDLERRLSSPKRLDRASLAMTVLFHTRLEYLLWALGRPYWVHKLFREVCVYKKRKANVEGSSMFRIIRLGDLNYRLNSLYDGARELISKNDWPKLLECDQLMRELRKGRL